MQPLLQWKSNKHYIISVCVCSLRYPACKAHAPYCHLWPARFYDIFPYYRINGKIFEPPPQKKKLLNIKSVVIYPTTFLGIFSKNTKLHENPSSGSRVVPGGHKDRQPKVTKLISAFRSFANARKTAAEIGTT